MSDIPPTTTTIGVVRVATDVVDAFKTSPVLLLIVLLNMAFAGAAAYYLVTVEDHRSRERDALIRLLDQCTMHTIPLEALPGYMKERDVK